jgi:hypothetical protein
MLTWILIALLIIIVIILMAAAVKSDKVHYERSAIINAAAERILPHIDDFHAWMAWSPYEKLDPAMQRMYTGAARGVGAKYAWSGNKKGGEGSMEILEISSSKVKIDLRFIRPFKNDCIAHFHLEPQGGATKVTWSIDGPSPFPSKVMSLFIDFDKLVGKDFEQGLADLKRIVEK